MNCTLAGLPKLTNDDGDCGSESEIDCGIDGSCGGCCGNRTGAVGDGVGDVGGGTVNCC